MSGKIKAAISVFSITVILACLIQAYPKFSILRKNNAIENSETSANSEVFSHETISSPETDRRSGIAAEESESSGVDYRTTQEYKDTAEQIIAVRERIHLLENGITSDLTDITNEVFEQITEISAHPDDNELYSDCRPYMTDGFYKRFKEMDFKPTSYMVYDIKFSDLDKEDISAYVLTRGTLTYIVTFSFDPDKNYVISNIIQLTEKE